MKSSGILIEDESLETAVKRSGRVDRDDVVPVVRDVEVEVGVDVPVSVSVRVSVVLVLELELGLKWRWVVDIPVWWV